MNNGKVNANDLIFEIISSMPYERKLLVKEVFSRLDRKGCGVVPVDTVLSNYDVTAHPAVASGFITQEVAIQHMVNMFAEGLEPNGKVTWREFMTYFGCMSVGIEDDAYFELLLRNAWTSVPITGVASTGTASPGG